jgi:hypothetical protein
MSHPTNPIATWADAEGVRLPLPFDGVVADLEALALLDGDVADADVVFLGARRRRMRLAPLVSSGYFKVPIEAKFGTWRCVLDSYAQADA